MRNVGDGETPLVNLEHTTWITIGKSPFRLMGQVDQSDKMGGAAPCGRSEERRETSDEFAGRPAGGEWMGKQVGKRGGWSGREGTQKGLTEQAFHGGMDARE